MKEFLVFDIETVALDFETLSESQQEYWLRGAETEEEIADKKFLMGLTPFTAQVGCIGMRRYKCEENGEHTLENKVVYGLDDTLEGDASRTVELGDGTCLYLFNEKRLLCKFWEGLHKRPGIILVSFNGRNFDAPFLMLRSGALEVRPSRNLMEGTKFNYPLHIDLLDQLTYFSGSGFGATKRFNFDFYARSFGITSPKAEGVDGSMVTEMFKEGKIAEISEYCMRDVKATWELYLKWNKFLNFGRSSY
ncbi:MAG: ribonuclease H-like domain-containing protein [Chloroflexota bacterium]